jgi:hypothetical protein
MWNATGKQELHAEFWLKNYDKIPRRRVELTWDNNNETYIRFRYESVKRTELRNDSNKLRFHNSLED